MDETLPPFLAFGRVTGAVSAADMALVLPVVLPMLCGAALVVLRRRTRAHGPVAVAGLALLFALDLWLLAGAAVAGPRTMMMGAWAAPFGIAFTLDLLGALFLALSGLVGLACGLYALAAVPEAERRAGFFPFLFLTMAGVSGAFLTGDVFNLYVWFEVLLIGSFGLLVLGSTHAQLDGTVKYAFLNLVATTLFLVATGFLYALFGTLNMADLAVKARGLDGDGRVLALVLLFSLAFAMKAAAFPVNAWLPASYHTPRFVTSALFAGLLTKVGVYALIRVVVMLFPPERAALAPLFALVAAATMITGALGALAQSDLRRLLNYVVVAGIGTALAGLAIPSAMDGANGIFRDGLAGTILYALHSIAAMAALYLAAGVAARRTGSSSLHEMGGLWRRFPAFSFSVLLLLLAVAGLPPLSGFWPKLMLIRASFEAGLPWLAAAIVASGFLLTLAAARVFALAFWRPRPASLSNGEREDFAAPMPDRLAGAVPILALLAFALAAGLWPDWLIRLCEAAAAGILDPGAYVRSVFASPA